MNKNILNTIALVLFFIVIFPAFAMAQRTVNFCCASQIAEAYGRDILEDFKKTTGLSVQLHVFESNVCIERLINGFSDISTTTLGIPYDLKEKGYVEIPFCRDPLVVITHPDCGVTDLSESQLRKIFSGQITNWKEVGGPDLPLIVIVPIENSGAFQNFRRQIMKMDEIRYDFMSTRSTMATYAVKAMTGSVSFIAQGAVAKEKSVNILKVNGLSHNDPGYPCFQTFSFVTKGRPAGAAKDVINYAFSSRGASFMRARGMEPVVK